MGGGVLRLAKIVSSEGMSPEILSLLMPTPSLGVYPHFVNRLDLQVPTQSCYIRSHKDTVSQRRGAATGRVRKALKQKFTLLSHIFLSLMHCVTVCTVWQYTGLLVITQESSPKPWCSWGFIRAPFYRLD